MNPKDDVVRWRNCPKCKGRGYFFINPFIPDWRNLGAPDNLTQCETCVKALAFFKEHEVEPTLEQLTPAT